jgi:hypothetical protein
MADPYVRKLVHRNTYYSKADIHGRVVVVLDGVLDNRGLQLIPPISRAFPGGTIIELIGTDERTAGPGRSVDSIAYIGFIELLDSGVLLAGDEVRCGDTLLGTVVGYDDTHMPNHQNTVIYMTTKQTGKDLGISVGDRIVIKGITPETK